MRAAHKGPTETPTRSIRNIYVPSHKSHDETATGDRCVVPRREPILQETAEVDDGITSQRNTNRDNADTDARHPSDTPGGMQGYEHAAIETTEAMETTKPSRPRTINQGAGRGKSRKELYVKGKGETHVMNR